MDLNFYLIGGVVLIISLIILNHQKQKNKMEDFLKSTAGMQPVFLQKSVEMKIQLLKKILYPDNNDPLIIAGLSDESTELLAKAFERVERNYADKNITLGTYNQQLFTLLEKANELLLAA